MHVMVLRFVGCRIALISFFQLVMRFSVSLFVFNPLFPDKIILKSYRTWIIL